jgi:hypothetical protein
VETFVHVGQLLRHTIAAPSRPEAMRVASEALGGGIPIQWLTPDVWTRRAVEAASLPGIVDAVPRFVVERGNAWQRVQRDAGT